MDETPEERPLFLIDASIYIFQSHFSAYVQCTSRQDQDLSALYGFIQFLLQFLRRAQPVFAAIAHDESLFRGFRHALCSNYKSNRELPDDNLSMQLEACHLLGEIFGLASYRSRVYEADDIIGTIASQIRKARSANSLNEPRQIQIVSRDKDLAQLLLTERDCLWDFSANKRRFRLHIEEEFGVSAEQLPDFLGLAGDAADCISGVPGIGAVKAGQLLREFGSLDEIYRNLDAVAQMKVRGAEKLATVLQENRDTAELSRKLATIVCEVGDKDECFGKVSLSDLSVLSPDLDELRSFLVEYSFGSRESNEIVKQAAQLIKDSSAQAV